MFVRAQCLDICGGCELEAQVSDREVCEEWMRSRRNGIDGIGRHNVKSQVTFEIARIMRAHLELI